ncbi:MAG: hypothetical protein GY757_27755, partial [bacterium]|nr:hypothetical protein [bacterium]
LEKKESRLLSNEANRAYNTGINDLLLSALGLALKEIFDMTNPLVQLEGHGREKIGETIELTRSVGQFTSLYPTILEVREEDDISKHIRRTKENLRKIPGKGIGYGILRYLSGLPEAERNILEIEPGIGFNYMEENETDPAKNSFKRSPHNVDEFVGHGNKQQNRININGKMENARLVFYINADCNILPGETFDDFKRAFKSKLEAIAHHCAGTTETHYTPSDYDATDLTVRDLEKIKTAHRGKINNIYNLSPMQEGMLFIYLYEPESPAYRVQLNYELKGDVDVELFRTSCERLIDKHEIFRTTLVHDEMDRPRQVVLKTSTAGEIPWKEFQYQDTTRPGEGYGDIGNINDINGIIQQDRTRGFDLQKDKLVRFTLVKTGRETYRLLLTYHHIIMDGWSTNLWMKDLLNIYIDARKGRDPEAADKTGDYHYSDYLRWLEEQDMERASEYWRQYLKEFDQATRLSPYEQPTEKEAGQEQKKTELKSFEHSIVLDNKTTTGLTGLSSRMAVTLNTLLQCVWGIVLHQYTGAG